MNERWIGFFLILVILSLFSFGCASSSKEMKTRCPKCASFFDTKEGEETWKFMRGETH